MRDRLQGGTPGSDPAPSGHDQPALLRNREIGSLTRHSLDFAGNPPTVTVQAVYSKRKRTDTLVLHPDVLQRLNAWLATKDELQPEDLLFPVSGKVPGGTERKTSKMMRLDLQAARKGWIKAATTDAERIARERTDFLSYSDSQGRYADFHANRHTFITNLGRAGVSPKTAQTLARHSDIRLTMNVYSHTDLAEKADAVRRLPGLWECAGVSRWHNWAFGATDRLGTNANGGLRGVRRSA